MSDTMKAQVFYEPLVMKYEDVPVPEIMDNEVLVKLKAVSICGSDISYYYGHSPLDTADGKGPLFLGHEASGVVVKIGKIPETLGLFSEGDRVTINPVQQCNACKACLRGEFNVCPNCEVIGVSVNGCFAEYVRVKYTHAYKIPDSIEFEHAALFEPLACATHGVFDLDIKLGQTVVVYGAGAIGLFQTQLAKAAGAGAVITIGTRDYNLDVAKKRGADHVLNIRDKDSAYYAENAADKVRELNGGELAQRCIVATSNMDALQDALNVTGSYSTIVYFGLPSPEDMLKIPVLEAIQSERTIRFAWLAPLVWDNVINAVGSGQIDLSPIITHRFKLDELEGAIKYMSESKDPKIKGVIVFD
jgi:L-iditol 2-dehydrogenase